MVHADLNPGNFLVRDDLSVGLLLDFGCIREVKSEFVEQYRVVIYLCTQPVKSDIFKVLAVKNTKVIIN
ncbi:AarF/UbiB family protein [Desulfobacter sp.]|uniref:AarF/UbiB family protein n=1 Tax=Desulfobacter sp. TaxID=2294 RepID=UPI003D14EE92